MEIKCKLFFCTIFLLLNLSNSYSNEINFVDSKSVLEKKHSLELHDLLNIGIEKNLSLKKSYSKSGIAKSNYKMGYSVYFPHFSISYKEDSKNVGFNSGSLRSGLLEKHGHLNMNYKIFSFGADTALIKGRKAEFEEIKIQEAIMFQDLIYKIGVQYYSILKLYEHERSAKTTEGYYQEILNAATLKYKIGLAPLYDKLKAKSSYSEIKMKTMQIANEIKKEVASLNMLLNLEADQVLFLSEKDVNLEKDIKEDVHYFLEIAKRNRVEIKALNKEKEAIIQDIKYEQLSRLPSLNLHGSISNYGGINKLKFKNNVYTIGFDVNMPIFLGFNSYYSIQGKKEKLKHTNLEIEERFKNISLEVWNTYYDYENAKKIYYTNLKILKTVEESAKLTMGMYKNGKASILDLLASQANLAETKNNVIKYKFDLIIHKISLYRVIGKLDVDTLINIDRI